ncbi:MAG: hypothetical protein K9H16_03755 [Bacteroidales bacterium]|nr:hypothetical protein [Bacteroidales bacterium]
MEFWKHKILVFGAEEAWNDVADILENDSLSIYFTSVVTEVFSKLIQDGFEMVILLNLHKAKDTIKLCKIIKLNRNFKNIPVIFISYSAGSKPSIDAYEAGADDFLTYPVNIAELADKVDLHFLLRDKNLRINEKQLETKKNIQRIAIEIDEIKNELLNQKNRDMEKSKSNTMRNIEIMNSRLLRTIVHELRSPVSAIIGFADLLNADDDFSQRNKVIESVLDASRRSKELLDMALVLSEIDLEDKAGNIRPFRVSDLFGYALRDHADLIVEKEIEILQPTGREITEAVIDPALIKEVVRIFIHNAVWHSPAGGKIVLDVFESIDRIELHINDNGGGFDFDTLNAITNFLKQKEISDKSKWPGLRFAIVKHLMNIHHAEIIAENNSGGGATVKLIFPVNNAQREALHQSLSQLN